MAERNFRRALAIRERMHPAGHWRIAEARVALGRCLVRAGRFAEGRTPAAGRLGRPAREQRGGTRKHPGRA